MNTESNKVLMVGIGETGLGTSQKIRTNKVKGITTLGIEEESQLKLQYTAKIQEAELVILVADSGSKKDDILTLQAAKLAKENGKIVAAFITTPRIFEGKKKIMRALAHVLAQLLGDKAHEIDHIFRLAGFADGACP